MNRVTPRRAAVGVALEPESSRWRLKEAFRLSVERTCTPAPTCNPRGCAYRLRDMTNWRTLQGAGASIPESIAWISLADHQYHPQVRYRPVAAGRVPVRGWMRSADPGRFACAIARG